MSPVFIFALANSPWCVNVQLPEFLSAITSLLHYGGVLHLQMLQTFPSYNISSFLHTVV